MKEVMAFIKQQQEAEEKGEHDFICPICGGQAHWSRAEENNHLHCGCKGCGFLLME